MKKNTPFSNHAGKIRISDSVEFLVLFLFFLVIIVPFLWMVLSSLKTTNEIFTNIWGFPEKFMWSNYEVAWKNGISKYLLNSVIVTIFTCLLTIICVCLSAFALSVFEFRGQKIIHALIVGGMMFSPIIALMPLYQLILKLNLYNKYASIILVYTAFQIPMSYMIVRNAFMDIDHSYVDAARIDGASDLIILKDVFLAMARPSIMTALVLTAFYAWNEFTFALIFIKKDALKTIPVGLLAFKGEMHVEWGVMLAGLTLSAIPIIVFFVFMQRYFIAGITSGGLKE